VSSILKALKKIEEESSGNRPNTEDGESFFNRIDTRKTVKRRAKGALLVNRVTSVLLLVFVVALAVWLFWIYQPFVTKAPPPAARMVPPVREEVKVASVPSQTPPSPQAKEQVAPVTQEPPARREPAIVQKKKTEETTTPKEQVASPGASSPPEPSRVEQPAQVRQSPPSDRTDEAKYKLEAIVWSSNAESRFAVINGQIVRSGGSVGNLSVKEIERDHVSVRSSNRDWKLGFTVE